MSELTPEIFNRKMAELEGLDIMFSGNEGVYLKELDDENTVQVLDYYNDLNLLMPLAWEHGIEVSEYGGGIDCKIWQAECVEADYVGKDQKAIIRLCLMEIAKLN